MMPEEVLKTSGHVDRFTDWMVKDLKTGDCLRADHLLEEHLEKLINNKKKPLSPEERAKAQRDMDTVDDMCTKEILSAKFKEYAVVSPAGNELSEPYTFNLMFNTSIGPTGYKTGYMRPETAQGMFINFNRLYNFAGNQLPFGAAQIGRAFRNEIAPRQGLLRVREFDLAEIEFFCDPVDKRLPKFAEVRDLKMRLLSRVVQSTTREIQEITIGEAVDQKIVGNETLAYFMARTQQFLVMCGLDPKRIRFRQHMASEMAHYASDCWDAEAHTSYGWIELVGHADRSAYDLTVHSNKTKVDMFARELLPQPIEVDKYVFLPNKSVIGKAFKKAGDAVLTHLAGLDEPAAQPINAELAAGKTVSVTIDGTPYAITPDMCKWEKQRVKESTRSFVPHVIEPAFGLGRIIYTLLEHGFYIREEDEASKEAAAKEKDAGEKKQRGVLRLTPMVAPVKCVVLPLSNTSNLLPFTTQLLKDLTRVGVNAKIDGGNASIGRRYARSDELGIPLGVTIDFDTVKDNTVTLRERDSMLQVRLPIKELPAVISELSDGIIVWQQVYDRFPHFTTQSE